MFSGDRNKLSESPGKKGSLPGGSLPAGSLEELAEKFMFGPDLGREGARCFTLKERSHSKNW